MNLLSKFFRWLSEVSKGGTYTPPPLAVPPPKPRTYKIDDPTLRWITVDGETVLQQLVYKRILLKGDFIKNEKVWREIPHLKPEI